MTNAVTIDVTSTLFQERGWREKLDGIRAAADERGFQLGIQLHNSSSEEEIGLAAAAKLPLTAHFPLLTEHMINLAASDPAAALEALRHSVSLARGLGVRQAVAHVFMMTDLPTLTFGRGRSYDAAMAGVHREELSVPGSKICGDFLGSPEHLERMERVKERLAWIRSVYSDVELLVENDFPCYGAGNLFADRMAGLEHPLCLDSGHLWAATHVFERDFVGEAEAFAATGRLKMAHFHSSACQPGTPKGQWTDGHRPLVSETPMDLLGFLRACRGGGLRHYVLEIRSVSAADIVKFAELWEAAAS